MMCSAEMLLDHWLNVPFKAFGYVVMVGSIKRRRNEPQRSKVCYSQYVLSLAAIISLVLLFGNVFVVLFLCKPYLCYQLL